MEAARGPGEAVQTRFRRRGPGGLPAGERYWLWARSISCSSVRQTRWNRYCRPRRRFLQWLTSSLSQQSSNVLFGQSRNVLLTGSSLEGGRRTTADDPSRARPAGGLEEGQEETDHAEAGCRGDRHHRAAGAATPAKAATERRRGGNP